MFLKRAHKDINNRWCIKTTAVLNKSLQVLTEKTPVPDPAHLDMTKTCACPKQCSSSRAETESSILVPQESVTRQLSQAGINHQSRQQEASDRDGWRSSVRKASRKLEAERRKAAKERRSRQKEPAGSRSPTAQAFVCPNCSQVCASGIGLHSHRRACKN